MRPFHALTERGQARRLRRLACAALDAYDLRVTGLRLIAHGWNCVFRVETPDGPRVLRVTRNLPQRAATPVASEVAFMTALAEGAHVAVARVVPDRRGELVTMAKADGVPEARPCVVFSWLGGSLLADRVDAGRWRALGELMGRMHRFAGGWTPPPGFAAPTYDSVLPFGEPLVMFEAGRADLGGIGGLLEEAFARTQERIAELGREVPRIVVHGDLHGWNVKVRRGILSPFDFEDLLHAAPILDAATSLYYIRERPDYPALAQAFRAGYERQLPWVEREPGELDRLLIARGLDLLNTTVLEPGLVVDDWPAFIRRRERLARIGLGLDPPLVIPGADGRP